MVSMGLVRAFLERGLTVAPFKKGPDFIDPGWLSFAANRPCYNLDPFLMNSEQILDSFFRHSALADISLIEGNRGLFDGMDIGGSCSTAELARLLKAPVLIVLDVTMTTRTLAAMVRGCQVFDPELQVAGVILNRVGGARQERLIRDAIEQYCGVPVVGALQRFKQNILPERHMGLVPYQESADAESVVSQAGRLVGASIDLAAVKAIAEKARPLPPWAEPANLPKGSENQEPLRIGFIRDRSFWFYYPDNLEQLQALGAEVVELDALSTREMPPLDALYIGGGFPETQAPALADNEPFRRSLKKAIEEGLPVYAECGGLLYLGRHLVVDHQTFPMVHALPLDFVLEKRPQGHGYTILEVVKPNPFYPEGKMLRGHEFHYSRPVMTGEEPLDLVMRVDRGQGLDGERDGLCKGNLLATYTHILGAGDRSWATGLMAAALKGKKGFFEKSKKTV